MTTPVCVGLHQVLRLLALPLSRYQLPTPLDGLPVSVATSTGDLLSLSCVTLSQQWSLCLQLSATKNEVYTSFRCSSGSQSRCLAICRSTNFTVCSSGKQAMFRP